MKKYIIDRIYDNYVVLECQDNLQMLDIEKHLLPQNIQEGSIIIFNNNHYYIDKASEIKKRITIQEKFNRLKNKQS